MDDINQMPFDFDPRIGMIVGVMVGLLVGGRRCGGLDCESAHALLRHFDTSEAEQMPGTSDARICTKLLDRVEPPCRKLTARDCIADGSHADADDIGNPLAADHVTDRGHRGGIDTFHAVNLVQINWTVNVQTLDRSKYLDRRR